MGEVLVQVVPLDAQREIGWGASLATHLSDRVGDIRAAIIAGSTTVAASLDALPSRNGWELSEVAATFGVTLTAEAGVLLTRASTGASFDVTVKFERIKGATPA